MQNPTSDAPPPAPLLHYETWRDATGYHARYNEPLPQSALHYGCVQTLTAATELELRQEAVRNRISIAAWDARERYVAAQWNQDSADDQTGRVSE